MTSHIPSASASSDVNGRKRHAGSTNEEMEAESTSKLTSSSKGVTNEVRTVLDYIARDYGLMWDTNACGIGWGERTIDRNGIIAVLEFAQKHEVINAYFATGMDYVHFRFSVPINTMADTVKIN